MMMVQWTRFVWDLAKLPLEAPQIEPQYHIRPATRDEVKPIRNMILSAFSLDSEWADTLKVMQEKFETDLDGIFDRHESCGLVLTHGQRIIGASVLEPDADAEIHLVSGPAILMEYRNRGLGAALLHGSLQSLREQGLTTARALTKTHSSTAKAVYRKFGGIAEACDYEPALSDS